MTPQDDLLKISTPENVAFSYPIAGIGSRFIAALVDTVLIILLQAIIIGFSGLLAGVLLDLSLADLNETLSAWIVGIFGIVSFVFLWGYYIFFEMLWNGQSPGKRVAKLRVVRSDGGPIALTESVVRNLVRLVDFLPVIYGLGVVVMFIDGSARRLGDLAAGTLVVRVQAESFKPPSPRPNAGPLPANQVAADYLDHLPLERLSPADLNLIESYLQRRHGLLSTEALQQQILTRIYERFERPVPDATKNAGDRLLAFILDKGRRLTSDK